MTKCYSVGDKSQAICYQCGLMNTTFARKDIPFGDGSGTVKDLLVAVCDSCGEVVSVPAQSTPEIKRAGLISS